MIASGTRLESTVSPGGLRSSRRSKGGSRSVPLAGGGPTARDDPAGDAGRPEDGQDRDQRQRHRHRSWRHRVDQHLDADERQDRDQRGLQEAEPGHRRLQQEVDGAQSDHGHRVGSEGNERVTCHAEHGWNRIGGEREVGQRDGEGDPDEARAGQAAKERGETARGRPRRPVTARPLAEEAGGGEDQERREAVGQPAEAVEQRRAGEDEREAQRDGSEGAVEQHRVAPAGRHGQPGEQRGEDQDVVDRERPLDAVGGEELHEPLPAEEQPDRAGAGGGETDPDAGPPQGVAEDRLARAPVRVQVDGKAAGEDGQEAAPEQVWVDAEHHDQTSNG